MFELISTKTYDLGNSSDYNEVLVKLGGKHYLQSNAPKILEALENTVFNPQNVVAKSLYEYQTAPSGFTDSIYMDSLYSDGTQLHSRAVLSYTHDLLGICLKYSLSLSDANNQNVAHSNSVFLTNNHHLNVDLDFDIQPLHGNMQAQAEIKAFIINNDNTVQFKEFALRGSIPEHTPIESITLSDPTHKHTQATDFISIAYGRGCEYGEIIDYQYDKIKLIPYERTNVQPLYLPTSGTIKLQDGVKIARIDYDKTVLYLDAGRGTCSYKNTIDKSDFVISENKNSFTYSLNDNWMNYVPSDRCPNEKPVDFTLNINFLIENDPIYYTAQVLSNSEESGRSVDIAKISKLMFYWGCLEANTLINLADGSKKRAKDICIGDYLQIYNEKIFSVCEIITGSEEALLKIVTATGAAILVTPDHPMLTNFGMLKASELNANCMLINECGEEVAITMLYTVKGDFVVYNFIVDDISSQHAIIANGFVTGDFVMQNSMSRPILKAMPDIQLLKELDTLKELL